MRTIHRSSRPWSLLALAAALGAAACTGATTEYVPAIDGGADAPPDTQPDAPGFFLLVPDTQVDVMEGEVACSSPSRASR